MEIAAPGPKDEPNLARCPGGSREMRMDARRGNEQRNWRRTRWTDDLSVEECKQTELAKLGK